jgi:hypothetical protein
MQPDRGPRIVEIITVMVVLTIFAAVFLPRCTGRRPEMRENPPLSIGQKP